LIRNLDPEINSGWQRKKGIYCVRCFQRTVLLIASRYQKDISS